MGNGRRHRLLLTVGSLSEARSPCGPIRSYAGMTRIRYKGSGDMPSQPKGLPSDVAKLGLSATIGKLLNRITARELSDRNELARDAPIAGELTLAVETR